MSSPNCEVDGLSVVLVGQFNPPIFHPSWLAKHGIIRDDEAEAANVKIVSPPVAAFSVGPFHLAIQTDKFSAETLDAGQSDALRDLVQSIFSLLEQTPVTGMGINRAMHFKMPSVDSWHELGHKLIPKEMWSDLLGNKAGTRSLIVQGHRESSSAEYMDVRLEPSAQVKPGIFISTNEHFKNESADVAALLDAMSNEWEPAHAYARTVADSILERCLGD